MNTMKKEAEKLPEDVELLLPWHAAGTLSRRDAARVEQALANDNELAARYDMVREELGEAIRLNETLGAPSARAMQTLFAKIDAEPARKPRASLKSQLSRPACTPVTPSRRVKSSAGTSHGRRRL